MNLNFVKSQAQAGSVPSGHTDGSRTFFGTHRRVPLRLRSRQAALAARLRFPKSLVRVVRNVTRQSERLVNESIAKDDNDPFAHYVASVVYIWKRDLERSAREADRALALNPNYALAINARALAHIYAGEPLEALPYIEKAIRLDPAQLLYRHFLGTAYFVAGNYETAAAVFKDRVAMVPNTDLSCSFLASALGHLGRLDEARRIWRELKEINPRYSYKDHFGRLPFQNPADGDKFTEGLRKAGLVE